MTTDNLQMLSLMSFTEDYSSKARQTLYSVFVMKMNKFTVFLKPKKIYFIHRNMLIGWFVVESYNYMRDLTF
jgi:Tfp pilus assembly protein PilZ